MLKNYFKVAWRNLLKSKVYSGINIIGLAAGMAVAMLIGFWIWDEISFDKYHGNHEKLARVMSNQLLNGEMETGPGISIPLGTELRTKHSGDFKYVTLTSRDLNLILSIGDKKITQSGMWVQPEFPVMLSLKMLKGSALALHDPSSMLLTASLAKSLFGDSDPINKTIRVDNKLDLKVAGVYEDLPHNSSFYETKCLMAWDQYFVAEPWLKNWKTLWDRHTFQLFVQLNEYADADKITAKIKDIPKPHVNGAKEEVLLHPMDKWHLYSNFKNGKNAGGRIQLVWLFSMIGIFVLLLACINFMNLSTARSGKRAKEVGIRKTIGSLRGQLIAQFLSESILVAILALSMAVFLIGVSLPFFNSLTGKKMSIPWSLPFFWFIILGFTFFTGLVSGSYPAFYLSGFKPIKVLKGTFRSGRFASVPRKVLVIVQFTVSVTLIIGTIIVFRQIQYAKNRPVGYSREGLITIAMKTPEIFGHYDALRNDLLQTGAAENMAESMSPTTAIYYKQIGFEWKGKNPNDVPLFCIEAVTHDFGSTIGWILKEGRDFSRSFPTDTGAIILNEAAVKVTGFKDPVGQIIKWNNKDRPVVGVVKDMVMLSPYTPIQPTVFFLEYGWSSIITIRLKSSMPAREAIAKLEPVFKKYNPESPFEYQFTDEEYAKKFSDEERISNLATCFAFLAIFISCLGLFGLASFVAEQRTKEIGVRKVLGASIFNLWKMLSKDFVLLVIISCALAIPIAWYFLHNWLNDYEYRTEISWWVFAVAGIGALLITLLTVSYQAIKAALANPVKSLRSE